MPTRPLDTRTRKTGKATAPVAPPRKTRVVIINALLKYLHGRQGLEIHNDEIAEDMGVAPADVRASLHNYIRRNPHSPVVETARYVYRWGAGQPLPASVEADPIVQHAEAIVEETEAEAELTPQSSLRVVARLEQGAYLLQDGNKNLWKAERA